MKELTLLPGAVVDALDRETIGSYMRSTWRSRGDILYGESDSPSMYLRLTVSRNAERKHESASHLNRATASGLIMRTACGFGIAALAGLLEFDDET